MKKFLVCGGRDWSNRPLMEAVLSKVPLDKYDTLIHGDCRGADRMAGQIAKEMGFNVIPVPADWQNHGKAAGPIRNVQMLTECKPDLVIAFHENIAESSGTAHMVKISSKTGVPVILIDGKDDYLNLEIS